MSRNSEEIKQRRSGTAARDIPVDDHATCGRSCYLSIIAVVAIASTVDRPTIASCVNHVDQDLQQRAFDMWDSGQEIVSYVRARGVKPGTASSLW